MNSWQRFQNNMKSEWVATLVHKGTGHFPRSEFPPNVHRLFCECTFTLLSEAVRSSKLSKIGTQCVYKRIVHAYNEMATWSRSATSCRNQKTRSKSDVPRKSRLLFYHIIYIERVRVISFRLLSPTHRLFLRLRSCKIPTLKTIHASHASQ